MQISLSYIHILCVVWIFIVYYGERTYPRSAIGSCRWPRHKDWPADARTAHVALIADPQIIDDHTYPGRNPIFQHVSESIVDLYLRRNWVYINRILDPDANLFLGDLFDGGREWEDPVWEAEFRRWNRIFTKPAYKRTIMSLPGNHDIGYGNTIVYHALQRFSMYFGEPSSSVDIGNHTFVLLDTISMLNTENSTIYNKPYDFINKIIGAPDFYTSHPRILLTHVPLFRDPKHPCGRHRESKKPLPYVKGYQYQTMATPEVSQTILGALRPAAVFSGDDHDACYVLHNYTIPRESDEENQNTPDIASTAEYTAKSISMAMGIGHPGIQLLSLYYDPSSPTFTNPGNDEDGKPKNVPTFATSICLMPHPFKAFVIYIITAWLTVTIVIAFNFIPDVIPPPLYSILSQRRPVYASGGGSSSIVTSPHFESSELPLYTSDIKSSSTHTNTTAATSRHSSSSSSSVNSINLSQQQSGQPGSGGNGGTAISRPNKQVSFALEEENTSGRSLSPLSNDEGASNRQSLVALSRRIRLKMSVKKAWKKVLKETILAGFPAFVFWIVLSRTIYGNEGL